MSSPVSVFSCSPSQTRLWLLEQLGRGGQSLVVRAPMVLPAEVDHGRVSDAVQALIARHEALRTTFDELDGQPVQRVHRPGELSCPVEAVDRQSPALTAPFDLRCGPLVRAQLTSERRPQLLLAFHHIVVDGWSIQVIHDDLAALIEGRLLPDLRVQYADFAAWQSARLLDLAPDRLGWWQQQFTDFAMPPPLFTHRGADSTAPGGVRLARTVENDVTARLRDLARARDATPFAVLLAAFGMAIGRLTGRRDLVVGCPVAGRTHSDLDAVVGFFVNTLPIRLRLDESAFTELVDQVRELSVEAFDRQDIPYEQISAAVRHGQGTQAQAQGTPLFEVMFNYLEGKALPGRSRTRRPKGTEQTSVTGGTHSDLELYALDFGDELLLELVYAEGTVDARTAQDLLDLTMKILDDPQHAVAEPPDPSPSAAEPEHGNLVDAFLDVSDRHAQRPAVHDGIHRWNYAELRERALGLATAVGDGAGRRVGVLARHDAYAVSAIVGTLCAGAAYVPLDSRWPLARLAAIIDDAGLEMIMVDPALDELRSQLGAARPELGWIDLTKPSNPCPVRPIDQNALAYLIYTSGTTGRPKGVMQSRDHVLGNALTYARSIGLACEDQVSLLPGLATDAGVMDLFGALLTGACLHPIDLHPDGPASVTFEELPEAITDRGITVLHSTPSVFRQLTSELDRRDRPAPGILAAIRAVVLGGEPAARTDLESFQRHTPADAVLVNGYGPTESTVALQFFADHRTALVGESVPLGTPVPGMTVSVQASDGTPTPPGQVGELMLDGPRLAPGYWQQPDETARAFAGGRYRTGDLVRVRTDGALIFAGRKDDQLKVRGYRIEPSEIEAALRRQPGVLAAAVTAGNQLTGHLVASPDSQLSPTQLRRSLRRALPDAMVPARYVAVDRLPLTTSGKVDRHALASLPSRPIRERPGTAAKRSAAEQALAEIWAEVLDADDSDIRAADTFFDFGGHSLLLTQVAARLADRLRVRVPLRALFDNPRLSDLAVRVEAELAAILPDPNGQRGLEQPIKPRTTPGPYPLSSAQSRLWFIEELSPGLSTYTMTATIPVPACTPVAHVQSAVDELLARHESLRTTFLTIEGQPRQQIAGTLKLRLGVTQVGDLDPPAAALRRDEIARQLASTAFDLRRGPLIRAHFVDSGRVGGSLFLAIHHIVADGWSLSLLRRECALLLAASRDGRGSPLPTAPLQYADYAVWEAQLERRSSAIDWWAEALAGAPQRIDLPSDRPRPATPTFRGSLASAPFPAGLAAGCRRLARERQTTPFTVYLAAFAAILHRWSGQHDLVLGTPVAGRIRVETEDIVGLFVNSLPLRLRPEPTQPFAEFLDRVREVVTAAQDHQEVPLEEIVRRVAPQRRLAYAPLFQVMFALGSARDEGGASEVTHTSTAKFDLSMTVDEGSVPAIYLEYAADLFDDVAPQCLLQAMVTLLAAVTADPAGSLAALPMGPEPDIDAIDLTVPRRLALPRGRGLVTVGAGAATTYDDLQVLVGRFAARLADQHLATGSVVAVDLPRGAELVAAIWAIRESGAAFLLLDPLWPERRRRELIDRAQVAFIVGPNLVCHPDGEPDVQLSGGYLVSTSGSTGRPKIVAVAGRAVEVQVAALVAAYELTERDRVLQFAALGFDVAIEEILPTLAAGATIDFGATDAPPTFAELDERCGPGGVTVLNLPASYWHEWVGYLGQQGRGVPAGLRLVIVGSEPVSPRAVSQWQALTPACRLLTAYGTSETTITNALFRPESDRAWADRAWADEERVPIGRALPNSRVLAVDPNGRILPPGAVGELVVEGECLALGYRGEPELTGRRFLERTGSRRRYLTGDLGRTRFDGQLELIGRLDDQIKLAGHRIEPGEIEATLLRQPGVAAAAVVVRAAPDGRPKLVAYLVATSEPFDTGRLRTALLAEQPEYLVPAAFVVLESLPRSAGGKLDRSLLPAPPDAPAPRSGPAPSGPIEQLVADIWAKTLRLPLSAISADSNFFDLGGDSILSLQVAWRLGARGRPVSLGELIAHQTVRSLAAALPRVTPVTAAPVEDEPGEGVPLTPIQRWQLGFEAGHPQHDNQAMLLTLESTVTVEALRSALTAIVVSHDALQLRFNLDNGEWRAHIDPAPAEPQLTVHPPGADLAAVAADGHAALDLTAGPVFRAELLPGSPARLLLIAHHLVIDVVSWHIIISDLAAALGQEGISDPPQLPRVPTSWSTWTRRLNDWAQGDRAAEQARWWLTTGPDPATCLRLPIELSAGLARDEDVVRATLDATGTAQLLSALPALDARIEEALVAAIALAVATDGPVPAGSWLPIDVEGHGRDSLAPDLDLSRTVGWFTTLRPVAVPVRAHIGEVLTATVAALRGMPQHGIAYGAVRWLRPANDPVARALRQQPAAEVSVNYLGRLDSGVVAGSRLVQPGGPAPGPARHPDAVRPYALDVVAGLREGELVIWLSHAGGRSGIELTEAIALRCLNLLRELAQAEPPDEPVASHRLTPMQEAMLYSPESTRGSGVYVEQSVLELPAGVDHHQLRRRWELAVRRHGILRTRFVENADGARVQQMLPEVRLHWRVVDWRHLAPDEAQLRLDGLLAEDRRRGFAIDRAPLMRLVVIQQSGGDRLVWTHHHALLDGWSAMALLEEIADRSAEPEPAPPFGDYLDWLDARDPETDRAYWTAQLADRPDTRAMPAHDVGAGQPRARALALSLPDRERKALAERARSLRVGVATLAHAGWALVVAEYLRSEDVTFGVTASGRPVELPGADRMIGLLITTHPARVRIPSATPLTAWAAELAAQEVTHREHAHAGLVAVGRWAGVPAGSPLFESLLVVENYRPRAGRAAPGEPGVVREIGVREIPDVPISVLVAPDVGLSMVFDARRFEAGWIGDLLQAFRATLAAIVAAADDTPVSSLRVLKTRQRERAIAAAGSSRPLPDRTLGAQWRAAARAHAQAVAITGSDGRPISYVELAADADRVTARLLAAGARPGDPIGLAGQRSAELVAAVLGIVQAGCAYVPLDPAYPDDRLGFMIDDTGMRLALAEPHLFDRLPASVDHLPLASRVPVADLSVVESAGGAAAPAYVIYTSGSTGQPKGVVVPHRAVTRLVINTDYCRPGPGDVVALASTFSFDASTFEIWGALLNGARLVPIDADTMLSPPALAKALRDHQVTTMFITTAAFNAVAGEQPDTFAPLSTVMFGGERVDPRSVRRVLEAGPPRRLLHVYGPTEATTFSSWYEVTDVPDGAGTVPIGGPIANTELLILDPRGEPVPAGVEGELCIGGPGLALGYLNDPELSAQRFVPHPWQPERTIYRTGDVVLRRSDGPIEIRGRLDGQVKIRGFRIEPGEVEAQLCTAPGVAAAVVVPRRESNDVHFLAGYAVPDPGVRLDRGELRTFLRDRLPEHLVPSALMIMDALPLNPNGKIDRARLPDPRTADPVHDQPTSATEEAIARIWSTVLKIDKSALGRDQDFFDLGGHSLLLTQVASRLRTELEVDVPLRSLFGIRRLADLATLVAGSTRTRSNGIAVLDREAHAAEIDAHGRLLVSAALRERLAAGG